MSAFGGAKRQKLDEKSWLGNCDQILPDDIVAHILKLSFPLFGYEVLGIARQVCSDWNLLTNKVIEELFEFAFGGSSFPALQWR
jgi:hypothetical protein